MPDAFLPGLYPSGEWIHPVKALPVGLVVPMVITREAPDLPPTAEFQTLLAPFQVRRGGMGFSPWWNRDLAVSLFAMGGGDAAAWRQWSQENNGGNDLAFQSGLLNLIPLQEIRENRLGAWVIPATRLPLLTRQELEGLAIRPVTVEGRVPLLPRTHWAVIPQGSGAGAEDFLSWLLDRDRLAGILADSASPSMTALAAPLRSETMPLPEFLGISGETPLYLPPEGPEAEDVDALFREELDWDAFRAKFVLTE